MEEQRLKEECRIAEMYFIQAQRRAEWLERRMYDAQEEADFSYYSSALYTQEEKLKELAKNVLEARCKYAALRFCTV